MDTTKSRRKILSTLQGVLSGVEKQSIVFAANKVEDVHVLLYLILPPFCCSVVFAFAVGLGVPSSKFVPGLVTTIAVLVAAAVTNVVVLYLVRLSSANETKLELSSIVEDFEGFLVASEKIQQQQQQQRQQQPSAGGTTGINAEAKTAAIISGHPHVSIVTTYRNSQWQRIPTLLLAEGDIIALMGGDITPGKVFELVPVLSSSSSPLTTTPLTTTAAATATATGVAAAVTATATATEASSSSSSQPRSKFASPQAWRTGKLYEQGVKIYLRQQRRNSDAAEGASLLPATNPASSKFEADRAPSGENAGASQPNVEPRVVPSSSSTATAKTLPSYARQRSLASDSIELLMLSGDIRCFQMAETPIQSFAQNLLQQGSKNASTDSSATATATLEQDDHTSTTSAFPLFGEKPRPAVAGEPGCGKDSVLRSLFNIILSKSILAMLIVLGLFCACAIVRLAIIAESRIQWTHSVAIPLATIVVCFVPASLPLMLLITEAVCTADILATTEVILRGEEEDKEQAAKQVDEVLKKTALNRSGTSSKLPSNAPLHSPLEQDDDAFSDDDEFLDEDIDERAEEIAEEASTKIHYWRLLQYFAHVLRQRLFPSSQSSSSASAQQQQQSPTSSDKDTYFSHLLPVPFAKTRLLETLGAVTMVCFVDDDIICEGYSVTEEIFLLMANDKAEEDGKETKGKVLDLHANPEATGSRFENPLWWKYLPSLKPIGLNALLTFAPTAPPPSIEAGNDEFLYLPLRSQLPSAHTRNAALPFNTYLSSEEIVLTDAASPLGAADGSSTNLYLDRPFHSKAASSNRSVTSKQKYSTRMETSLVGHVRKAIPLEALRELAEEIGFVKQDVEPFLRLLEMNVMAPGLGDVRLLEDTHAWGQEETRRRGTLMSQVRGAVVQDKRGGGLQLMSQGDPSLILNYCREYWDGSSITPLSPADRKEVLAVYDRWDLEDFDVVAFSYSPIPYSLHELILKAHGESEQNSTSVRQKGSGGTEVLGADATSFGRSMAQTNCLFFVDPRTSDDLSGMSNSPSGGKKGGKVKNAQLSAAEDEATGEKQNQHELSTPSSTERAAAIEQAELPVPLPNDNAPLPSTTTASSPPTQPTAATAVLVSTSNIPKRAMPRRSVSDSSIVINDGSSSISRINELATTLLESEISDSHYLSSNAHLSDQPDEEVYQTSATREEHDPEVRNGQENEDGEQAFSTSKTNPEGKTALMVKSHSSTHSFQFLEEEEEGELLEEDEGGEKKTAMLGEEGGGDEEYHNNGSNMDFGYGFSESALLEEEEEALLLEEVIPLAKSVSLDGALNRMNSGGNVGVDRDDLSAISRSSPLDKSILFEKAAIGDVGGGGGVGTDTTLARDRAATTFDRRVADSPRTSPRSSPPQKNSFMFADGVGEAVSGGSSLPTPSGRVALTAEERRLRLLAIEKRKNDRRVTRSLGASLWPLMRQQVFLGMAASSVPIRREVPNLMEDLTAAGVRFVYFSPRNMRRSKPVAEKIGIQFDWNCAISLRDLHLGDEHDPHRYISNYADWDVHARMPHGVEAIKSHLREVDNVPLLVSLYTDATPVTIRQIVKIFREYGEVVLTVGSSYRSHNQEIFNASNVAVSVAMLPGDVGQIPSTIDSVIKSFPEYSSASLTQSDLLLNFRLVGLGSTPLLQTPAHSSDTSPPMSTHALDVPFGLDIFTGKDTTTVAPQLRMAALLEAIRKGRVLLLNILQALGMLCVSSLSLGLWPLVANAVPVAIPPSLPPCLAILFIFVHVPIILFTMLHSAAPEGVLKNTPRKNVLTIRHGDESRFATYLLLRAGYVAFSVFVVGWLTKSSFFLPSTMPSDAVWYKGMINFSYTELNNDTSSRSSGLYSFWLLQDVMSCQMLLSLLAQASCFLERGQTFANLPKPWSHPYFYLGSLLVLLIHAATMAVRAFLRSGVETYASLNWLVWVAMVGLPLLGIALGLAINAEDNKMYRRQLQFLRLEFDTRLGMHSPR